jgi:hypothetical protein
MSEIHSGFISALEVLQNTTIQPQNLYEQWWSGRPHLIEQPGPHRTNFHPDIYSRRVQSSGQQGSEIHTLGYATVELRPGDFYNLNERDSVVRRWASWSNNYWNWIQGIQIPLHPIDPWQLRIYIPTTKSPNGDVAKAISWQLDESRLPYRLKYRQSSGTHTDSIVMWIERRHYQRVFASIIGPLEEQTFEAKPPPLTYWRGNIGICDHPRDGQSVGWMYSEFLWQLVRSGSEHKLQSELEKRGFDARRPWRLNAESNSYWDDEMEQ